MSCLDKATSSARHDPWRTHSARIERMRSEAPDVHSYDIAVASTTQEPFAYRPGQFNMLYVPGVGEAAISIAGRASGGGGLRHTVRTVGAVTEALQRGGVGMSLGLRGPFGVPWPTEEILRRGSDLVVVAGGIGLAPLRALILFALEHREQLGDIHVLVGARTPRDLIYRSELQDWAAQGADIQCTVDRLDDQWAGAVGVVTLLLERLPLRRPDRTLVMSCGPEVMMRYVAQTAIQRGIPPHQQWVTLERNMNCAIGLCGHCQLGPTILCRDGPVFRYDRVEPWLRVQEL